MGPSQMKHPPEFGAYSSYLNLGEEAGVYSQVWVGKGSANRENSRAKIQRNEFRKRMLGMAGKLGTSGGGDVGSLGR